MTRILAAIRRCIPCRDVCARTRLGLVLGLIAVAATPAFAAEHVNVNEVRRILSENCFSCHGPDVKPKRNRKPLRLDSAEAATAELSSGQRAIVPGSPEKSEMIARITATDLDDLMPPPDTGKKLTASEIELLKKWIRLGAPYARHWAYVPPARPALPEVRAKSWPRNGIDRFILARLEKEELRPQPEAEREALVRRVALDLTGLPPTLEEVDEFLADRKPGAYERWVDRLLAKPAFGEHWARLWLDQARYADSTGYADDPPRTIWAFRDWVIRALNANKPYDQFTIEQLAGDLLDDPTDEQQTATAFHRNTMTNNEGGTSDEEYRNVAIVDRVNTTMAVWMGTTMACAQCHNHKYDPITQEDYFRMFAVFNNTADADRGDEKPVLELYSSEQKQRRKELQLEIARLEKIVRTPTPELESAQRAWETNFATDLAWQPASPVTARSKAGATVEQSGDGAIRFSRKGKTDVYTLEVPVASDETITALRIDALPDETLGKPVVGHADGNFVVSRVLAAVSATNQSPVTGRYVRIELPGKDKYLSLAEVQVFSAGSNIAGKGKATQSSTAFDGPARLAIDGNTDGNYAKAKSTTHTDKSSDPWWELDLGSAQPVDRIAVWNRTDSSSERLSGFRVVLLDEKREVVWRQRQDSAPKPSATLIPDGSRVLEFADASARFSQKDFGATNVLRNSDPKSRGWAIAPRHGEPHSLMLTFPSPVSVGAGSNLVLTIEQVSKFDHATIAKLRVMKSSDSRGSEFARVPQDVLAVLRKDEAARTPDERKRVQSFYLAIAPGLAKKRAELAAVRKKLESEKPYTTVPILEELAGEKRRLTHVQLRGNFLELGPLVTNGLPAAFSTEAVPVDRLGLARWLVSTNNPLTARVAVNRFWETIFGVGLVRTSEEFGAQGELPSHPELLDWLGVEFMESGWDTKHVLRLMVTSAAYRQSSRVTPELAQSDPDNRLLARGPRFRLSAETIRDQALAVSGLLSQKMFGPPVKPPQPKMGLSAAFGSGTDWEPSTGEDRYRRALYTTWRRSNPYPSMLTFDAPNREFCVVRRERSNTPLQALVTLNDPVYVEAAQALARNMASAGAMSEDKLKHGFRRCLSREPSKQELGSLASLYRKSLERFQADPAKAMDAATKPLGPLPDGANAAELAAWTMVANVMLNLDEMLMKR